MLNENDDVKTEKIYTDLNFQTEDEPLPSVASFSKESAPVKQGPWGIHEVKPPQQTKWEMDIKAQVNSIIAKNVQDYFPYMTHVPQVAAIDEHNQDCRPRLFDPFTKQWVLVDSCAQVSIWPKDDYR